MRIVMLFITEAENAPRAIRMDRLLFGLLE
jgi:hypothetical protein